MSRKRVIAFGKDLSQVEVHLVDLVTTAAATAKDLVTWTKGKSQLCFQNLTALDEMDVEDIYLSDSHFPVTSV